MDLPPKGAILAHFLDGLVRDELLFPILGPQGEVIETYCNIGAKRCAPGEDFHAFEGKDLLAEGMGRIMRENHSGLWKLMSGAEAALWAMQGRRAMAFMSKELIGDSHAHIARVYPKDMTSSDSLHKPVPWVANIGKGDPGQPMRSIGLRDNTRPNWVCKSSQAFPVKAGEALYYGWMGA